jgi:sec-independent protein translocase protein TatB
MFGLSFEKLMLIAVLAVVVVGPQRLPRYAAQLAKLVRAARDIADTAKERVRQEMGSDFDDVDWKKLDPRQYDPRRIIRDALFDGDREAPTVVTPARPSSDFSSDLVDQSIGPVSRSAFDHLPDASPPTEEIGSGRSSE